MSCYFFNDSQHDGNRGPKTLPNDTVLSIDCMGEDEEVGVSETKEDSPSSTVTEVWTRKCRDSSKLWESRKLSPCGPRTFNFRN